jgi:hypothetical protein
MQWVCGLIYPLIEKPVGFNLIEKPVGFKMMSLAAAERFALQVY